MNPASPENVPLGATAISCSTHEWAEAPDSDTSTTRALYTDKPDGCISWEYDAGSDKSVVNKAGLWLCQSASPVWDFGLAVARRWSKFQQPMIRSS